MRAEVRRMSSACAHYDTRHVVFRPAGMDAQTLESGYWRAYEYFYRWRSIWAGASARETLPERMRHMAYSAGWKKFEPVWDLAIRSRQVVHALPLLEAVLTGFVRHRESGVTGNSRSGSGTSPAIQPGAP